MVTRSTTSRVTRPTTSAVTGVGVSGGGAAVAPFASINDDGWSAEYADTPPTFEPDTNPVTFSVSRAGFTSSGAATTVSETLVVTKRVRLPYPDQATLDATRVALSDYIYSTDTVNGATNNSTEASPKPVANWATPDREVVGNTINVEVVAFHRNASGGKQVACVEFRATDGTTTVTQVVSNPTVSTLGWDQNAVIVYAASLDITTLNDDAAITVNAKVYPRIGNAASVLDSADQTGRREFSPRTYYKNVSLAASPVYVYVSTTGNDTTGAVDTDPATAEGSPCATIAGAINRAIAVNGEVDGVIIRCMIGTHTFSNVASTRTQNIGRLTITRDPNESIGDVVLQFGASSHLRLRLGAAGGWLKIEGVTLSRQGTFGWQGEAGSPLEIWFHDCEWDNNSHNSQPFGGSIASGQATKVRFIELGSSVLNAGTNEWRMFRGCTSTTVPTTVEGWLVLGCNMPVGTLARGTRTASQAIVAFNVITRVSTLCLDLGASENVTGYALVQNVFEYISATANPIIRVSGDSATGATTHVVMHHNTVVGFFTNGRSNLFYDDGATARTNKLHSYVGQLENQINHKGDVFDTDGTRLGNWAFLYGVGCRGVFSQFIDAQSSGIGGSFAQEYPGLGADIGTSASVRNDPNFLDYQGTTSGPTVGAGNGSYVLVDPSPAEAILADPALAFDLAGESRPSSNDTAGAYLVGAGGGPA